jgi:dienelactone hydrolase
VTAPGLEAAFIRSGGFQLLGGLYRAAGDGPLPAALLLHGLPGHEKNLDLAADLRQLGLHCLYLHYRGAWGSEGDFSCAHLLDDATAGFEWLARRPTVDPRRIAVIGFSLGGWVACALAAQRAPAALVAVSPLVDPGHVPLPADLAAESAATLRGTTAERLTAEWASLTPATEFADALQNLEVLLVTGDRDTLFPPPHFELLTSSLPHLRRIRFPHADHLISDVRPGLRHVIGRWLVETLPA